KPLCTTEQPDGSGPIPNDVGFSQLLIRRHGRHVTGTGPEELRDVLAAQRSTLTPPTQDASSRSGIRASAEETFPSGRQPVVEVVVPENPLQQLWVLPYFFTVKLHSIVMGASHQAADLLDGRITQKHHPLNAPLRGPKRVLPGAIQSRRYPALASNLRIG